MPESGYVLRENFRERRVISRRITEEQLLEVSDDLWGSTAYGQTAASLLRQERTMVDASVASTDSGGWRVDGLKAKAEIVEEARPRTEEEMTHIVLDIWDQEHYPFEPKIEYSEGFGHFPAFSRAKPGPVTRLRLADFVRNRGYHTHELQGTLGKTFDLLSVLSGIKKANEVKVTTQREIFITAPELRLYFREIALSQNFRNEIRTKLTEAARLAIYHAKVPDYGEIIFEGEMRVPCNTSLKFESVALSSLAAMAKTFPKDRPTYSALSRLFHIRKS